MDVLLFWDVSISWEFFCLETDLEHPRGLWESPVGLKTLGPSGGQKIQLATHSCGECLSLAQEERRDILYGADIWANLQEREHKCRE